MSIRSITLPALVAMIAGACQSTMPAPSPATQTIVEAIAAENPDIQRLSVHMVPDGGTASVHVASTMAERLGKPSDEEDLDAMKSGRTIVIDESGSLDVTVPICKKDGKFGAAAGITFKTTNGSQRDTLVARAEALAKTIEARMAMK